MSDVLGADAGSVGVAQDNNMTNEYTTISDQSVDAVSDRVTPDQVATGTTRGTQTIMNVDGSYMTLGLIPDGGTSFGIAFFDSSGFLVRKITQNTDYIYDKNTGKNVMQLILLPDGTYGFAVARTGTNVADGITT